MTDITKSAPLPERPCEQLTCCALCICDPDHKHTDDSRYQAGGQGYQPGGRFLPDLRRRGHFAKKSSMANLSGLEDKKGFVFSTLDNSASSRSMVFSCFCRMISQSGEILSPSCSDAFSVIVLPCKAMRRSTSHHGADSDYSDSLALRRCSYFNLRPQASKTHAEKLALGLVNFSCSTLASIPSISSCGNRIFFFADLLFVLPLDIDAPYLNGLYGRTQYSKKNEMLSIDMCAHIILICAHSLSSVTQIKQRPAVLATHAGRLTTNDNESIEAAMRNHTTHPQGRDSHNLNKYIWRFIALSTAQPRVIHIVATSEQEARQQSPDGCVMVFAARIRQGSHHA